MEQRDGHDCCRDVTYGKWGFVLTNPIRRALVRPQSFAARFVNRGDTVADIGCGTGLFTFALARAAGSQGRVIAVDHDERSIATVRRRAAREGLGTVASAVTSATVLTPIPDRSVDFLLSNLVLCCLTDHDGAVAEIQRVLKPSGSAYVSVARWSRSKHPTTVDGREWRSILEKFRVIAEGHRLTLRWAQLSVA